MYSERFREKCKNNQEILRQKIKTEVIGIDDNLLNQEPYNIISRICTPIDTNNIFLEPVFNYLNTLWGFLKILRIITDNPYTLKQTKNTTNHQTFEAIFELYKIKKNEKPNDRIINLIQVPLNSFNANEYNLIHEEKLSIVFTKQHNITINIYKKNNDYFLITENDTNTQEEIEILIEFLYVITNNTLKETINNKKGVEKEFLISLSQHMDTLLTKNLDAFDKTFKRLTRFNFGTFLEIPYIESLFNISLEDLNKQYNKNMASYKESMTALNREYKRILEEIRNLNSRYEEDLKQLKNNEYTNELIKYLCTNKNLQVVDVNGDKLTMSAKSPIVYYDKVKAQRFIERCAEDCRKLLTEIFVEGKYQVWTRASLILHLNTGYVEGHTNNLCVNEYVPHPHLATYSCFGDHSRHIKELTLNKNYIEAIEQCLAAMANLNFSDSPVATSLVIGLTQHYSINHTIQSKENQKFYSFEELRIKITEEQIPVNGEPTATIDEEGPPF